MRALLSLIERLGGATIAARALDEALAGSSDARATIGASREAGVVVDAPHATTFPCPGVACARDVREGRRRLLAVCTLDPSECDTLEITREDLVQVTLSCEALAAVTRRLFGIATAPRLARAAADAASQSAEIVIEPLLLGEQPHAGAARDVFLAIHPARTALASFLALRERAARATLVFAPTPDAIAPELVTRHAPGAHVELAILSDALAVRDGRIALAPRLRVVRGGGTPSPTPAVSPKLAPASPVARSAALPASIRHRLPAYASWSDLHFRLADGVTLLVTVGSTSVRLSYFDLGLDNGNTRDPTRGWKVLRAVCEGHGAWDWRAFGDKDTVPQLVSELQKILTAAFDLTEKPFGRLTRSKGYKPKFRASPGPGGGGGEEKKDEGGWSG